MRYTKNDVLPLEPEHERIMFDDDSLSVAEEPVYIRLDQRVHNPNKPYLTYWEVTYMTDTPNNEVSDTRILTENIISTHEVPEVTEDAASMNPLEAPTDNGDSETETVVHTTTDTEPELFADPS